MWLGIIINNWKSILLGVFLTTAFFLGWIAHGWFYEAERAKEMDRMLKEAGDKNANLNQISVSSEEEMDDLRKKNRELMERLEDMSREIPNDCTVPDNVVRLLNE